MSEFNPNTTATKGIEWFPHTEGVVTLDSLIKCAGVAVLNTTSQGTNNVKIPVTTIPVRGGLYAVEVYDNETGVAANVTTLTAQPNEDVSGTGAAAWQEDDGTTTTIYDQIDETTLDTADYIKLPTPTLVTAIYTGRFNTGGLSLTSKRILAVRLNINCLLSGNATLQAGLNIGGTDYAPIVAQNTNGTVSYTWLYNPKLNMPWRIADVQALDTTDEYLLAGYVGGDGTLRVYQVWLDVVICDENRIAFGAMNDISSGLTANAWNTVAVLNPTSGAWTKDGTGYHLYTVRRINSVGSLNIPYHLAAAAPNPARAHLVSLNSDYGYIDSNSATAGYVHPLVTQTASVDSVDGMPYFDLAEATVHSGASRPAQAEFSNAAAAAYGIVRCLVKPNDATQPLTIQIWNRTGPAQVGGTLTLTKAQVDALPDVGGGWKFVTGQLSSNATLAAATQYYILYQSTATGAGTDYWSVRAFDTFNSGNTASFGGTTDRGTYNAVAEADRYDVSGTISTVPTTPANFAATLTTQNVTDSVCSITTLQRASLSWSATALGGTFTRYEIERTEDGGTTWTLIANVTVEAVVAWIDYEARMGVQAGYRIRVVRSDGAVSAWSSTVNVTKTTAAAGCTLAFVSNYAPTYNLIYDYHPEVSYDFLEDDERVVLPIYGVDKSLGFQPIEDRGTRGNWRLWVGWNGRGTAVNGKQVFDPLRTTARAQLPYVCVLDHFGNRMYAQLSVGSGRQVMPQQEYVADVAATEVVNEFVPTVTA